MAILTEKSIKNTCTYGSTYTRGNQLFMNDAVQSLLAKKTSDHEITLLGMVEGSGINEYNTKVKLRWNVGDTHAQIWKGDCECPAYAEYGGFCKHLVATLIEANFNLEEGQLNTLIKTGKIGDSFDVLEYDEWEDSETFEGDENPDGKIAENKVISKGKDYLDDLDHSTMIQRGVSISTTSNMPSSAPATASGRTFSYSGSISKAESSKELLDAISGVVLQQRNQFCQELSGGDVSLEVTLFLEANQERIELRIGKKQMYVVKDIELLVENIRRQNYVKYGKNLEFVHTQSAFTKESLEIVSFLLDAPFRKKSYSYWIQSGDKRSLDLNAGMLEELLQIFEGRSLWVKTGMNIEKELTPVKRENPVLPLFINGVKQGKEVEIQFPEILLLEGVHGFAIWWEDCIYLCSEDYCREMKEIVKLMAVNKPRAERQEHHYYSFYRTLLPLHLCESDYASFCATLLPVLEKYMDVQIVQMDFTRYQIEEGKYELYLDITKNGEVTCRAEAIYGERHHNLIKVASLEETYRDVRTEYELRTLLEQYFPEKSKEQEYYLLKNDDDRLAALVENGVGDLRNFAEVFVSEAFKKIRIATSATVITGLSIKGNLLNVTWNVEGMSKEELYDILGAYKRKRKYFRLKNGELLNLSESGLSVLSDMQNDLHLSKAQLKAGMAELPIYRSLYLNALMKENADRIIVTRNAMFEKFICEFEEGKTKEYELPQGIQATLREYQMTGYRWACSLSQMGFGGILADDMGLGKTLQMITYLCSVKGMTHLVVCPASLVYNWEAEFQKFAPDVRTCVVAGNAEDRKRLLEEWRYYDVLITSYDLLKRDIDCYMGKHFGCEIIDEAQYIKNPATQASKAVKSIDSRTRFALTGTPIENRMSELWSIFEYLMPGYLYSYKYFKENFEEQILQETEEEHNALNRLHTMISPFLLRRLKGDVLKDLPDKIEEVVYTRFDKEQEKLYKATEKKIVDSLKQKSGKEVEESKLQILAELTKLRQICCDPALLYENCKADSAKLATCMEVVKNAVEGGHRILLFSQFTSMLDIIEKELKKEKISYFILTGSTSKAKRRDLVEQFQSGRADVFLISLKAGGTGLNLTAADMVIHYDPWWNVAAQNQATDRTHRIGQKRNVTVMKLIAKDTIEERILKLQEKKQDLADKIMSAEGVSLSALSRDELLGLLEHTV